MKRRIQSSWWDNEDKFVVNLNYTWAEENIFGPLATAIREKFLPKYKTFQFDLDDLRTSRVGAYCDVNLYVQGKLRGEYEFRFVAFEEYDSKEDFMKDIKDTIKEFVAVLK